MKYLYLVLIYILATVNLYSDFNNKIDNILNNVFHKKMDNGITVLIYQRKEAPVFSGVISFKVGGVNEKPGITGSSHIFEHMAFKGTKEIGTLDYQKEKELLNLLEVEKNSKTPNQEKINSITSDLEKVWDIGALDSEFNKRGASGMNATTSAELTNYFVSFPKEQFPFWVKIESERIINPVMRQFYKELEVVKEERRMRYDNDPFGKMYETLLNTAFDKHPYRNPVIGYKEDLDKLTVKRVEDYRKKYYVGNKMVISIVGDLDPKKTFKMINKHFKDLPSGEESLVDQTKEPTQLKEKTKTLKLPYSPKMLIAYKKVNYPDPEDAAISILSQVVAGSSISRLQKNLVKDNQIANSVSTFEAPGYLYPNLLIFSLSPREEFSNKELLAKFDTELDYFKNNLITKEDLEIAKRAINFSYLQGLKGNMSLALDLARTENLFGSFKETSKWLKQIDQVTIDDVSLAAKKYLNKKSRTIIFLEEKK